MMQLFPSLCVLLGVAFVAVHCKHPKAEFIQACASEFSIKSDEVKPDFSKDMSEVSENIKCFVTCVAVKDGVLTADGELVWDKIEEKFPKSKDMKDDIEKCIEANNLDKTSCSFVFGVWKCAFENRPH